MTPILFFSLALCAAPVPTAAVQEGQVTVDAVWYSSQGGGTGGTSPVEITIRPNGSRRPKVGIFEDRSQGTGEQWRNSVWMAAYLAALTAQRLPTEIEVSVSSGGKIDGPSAGGLMTAGMLAAMLGTPVDPLAAMSGTINPDGTIGPVGGLPLKLQGAARKGKKRFGYPLGERMDTIPGTNTLVDLNRLGASLSVETREVRDVYDAYRLLTGKELPRPEALPPDQLAVAPEAEDVMQRTALRWIQHAGEKAEALAKVRSLDEETLKDSIRFRDRALQALKEGNTVAAYDAAFQAVSAASGLEMTRRLAGTPREAEAQVEALFKQLGAEVGQEERRLAAQPATTVPELVRAVGASLALVQCRVLLARALERVKDYEAIASGKAPPPPEWKALESLEPGPERDQWVARVFALKLHEPVVFLSFIRPMIERERDLSQVPVPRAPKVTVSTEELRGLARMYAGLAQANLDYFESIVLRPEADQQGVSVDLYRSLVRRQNYEYEEALLSQSAALGALEGDSAASALAAIAAAQRAQLYGSVLIAIHYSLGVQRDGGGQVLLVRHQKAFTQVLDSAEQKAREAAAVAKQRSGAVPLSASILYENARVDREGDQTQKLMALRTFWSSSAASQLAALLARAAAGKP